MTKSILVLYLIFNVSILFGINEIKVLNAVKIKDRIKIDGLLLEEVYEKIHPVGKFTQYHPKNGNESSFATFVYCFYDENNIYFSFKCFDSNPEKISADITSFGQYENNDEVIVYVDTFLDKQTYETFAVNPKGIKRGKETIWDADAHIGNEGWTAEIKIPFKSLRFPRSNNQHWAVNFSRIIPRLNETIFWNPVERNMLNTLGDTFASLEGINDVRNGKNIEIFPYAGLRNSMSGNEKNNKFAYGLDLKYGLTSNLTLDFTSSPDYSEVESDPFFFNLNPYEVNLAEKRPFYLEGASYFNTPFILFYSRRISNPTLAFKITGKERGNSIGILAANNKIDDQNNFFGVLRYNRNIFSLSNIGFIYSTMEDKGDWNRNIGMDFNFNFKNIYSLDGMIAFSFNKHLDTSKNGMYNINFSRNTNKGLSFSGSYIRVEPNVFVSAGYSPIVDFQGFSGSVYYAFLWEGNWLEKLSLRFWKYNESSLTTDLKTLDTYTFGLSFFTKNKINISTKYKIGEKRPKIYNAENDLLYDNIYHTLDYNVSINYLGSRHIEFDCYYDFSKGYVYNNEFTQTQKGKTKDVGLSSILKISSQLQFTLEFSNYRYQSENGEIKFDGSILSGAVNYQPGKKITTYIKFQYDSFEKRYAYDLILGYEPAILSKIYFTLKNYSEDHLQIFHPSIRSISFKLSYLLRI
jgi:hypothetical protein